MTTEVHGFPKRISPCPIVEAIVELRFSSAVLPDAVFGIIYQEFGKDFSGRVEKLPILQLPEPIRAIDPNLMYQPHYKLVAGNLLFQIGPRVTSLSNFREYMGWDNFARKLTEVFLRLQKLQVVKAVERLGIRYINLFKDDVYNNINLIILMNDEPLRTVRTTLRAEIEDDGFTTTLQIANPATLKIQSQAMVGSVIDIDVARQVFETDFFGNMESILEKGHYIEKKLFFSLLKMEFLSTLNPEY
jgi:uncharacterized protein (TIGR04255 family)